MFGTSHLLIYDVSSIETDFTVFIKERKREIVRKNGCMKQRTELKLNAITRNNVNSVCEREREGDTFSRNSFCTRGKYKVNQVYHYHQKHHYLIT